MKKHKRKNSQTKKIINDIIDYNKYLKGESAKTTIVKNKIAIKKRVYKYLKPAPKKKVKPWSNIKEMKAYKKAVTKRRKYETI